MKKILLITVLALFAGFFAVLAQTPKTPVRFAEGVVDTAADEYNPTFTPDGKIVFFTRRKDRRGNEQIMFSRLENGKWSEPQVAPFSGKFQDKEPSLAPDGKRLFFASSRPNGRDAKPNFDIWFVEKTANGWSEPQNLGENVNSPGYDNYPSVAADGTLYFASVRIEGRKDNDLYRSRLVNGQYQKAENLGEIINTPATEADPFVAPDQSYLIICSDRPGSESEEGDLYVSFNRSGKWTVPQSLGKIINTADYEYTPLVSPDGKKFYFSRGWGDIYEIDFAALNLAGLRQTAKESLEKPELAVYAGEYEFMPGRILIITAENGALFSAANNRKNELQSIGADRFTTADKISISFVRDSNGKVTELILIENGQTVRARKIK